MVFFFLGGVGGRIKLKLPLSLFLSLLMIDDEGH